ncbi:outer membrane protein assembly factor BamA [Pseudorhodoplanes sp.]|uniref:outer membrane protein assembly factor BamA n=1 Tax=Pseudorhodoplanes sp. TaxID=1934341 RepID=UPI002BD89A66|nr:outer membrane protein assembly factor BamA [Pseudorhodoplanes sp.]HWV42295.1 outer membrane protein assembly factor BamA [Pseudorhodoplanes sp.]
MGRGARVIRGWGLAAFLLGGSVFGVAVTAVTAGSAYAQSASNIVVEGNRRVEADTIRSYFRSAGGLNAATIDEGLKGLYATGLFQDIRIRQAGGRLIVTVVENPVINRIAFEGNIKAKDEQLLAEIQSKVRGTLSRPIVQSDTQRIIEQYRRNGRFDVRVVPKIIELPNNRVDLVFEITEGKKTGVKSIRFVGNRNYSDVRLKDVIKTTETNLLSFLKSSDVYDPDRIEADRDLLRRFYLKHGFADVRIVSAVSEYDPSQSAFIVTFTIDEGDQYKFGSVDIQSNVRAVDAASMADKLKARAGQVYNAEAVEKSVEAISIDVARRGYPFAVVRPRGDRDFERRLINVVFTVDEGPRAYIERIQIRGNTRTRDWVIRREFDLAEGDAYNRALIDRAERRLKNLNYFKSVKITSEPGTSPDRVVVNVEVEEQSTGEFSISGGYSTQDGWLGEVSIGERNLLGRGQAVRAAVQYGQRARGFELSFVEPYFLDYRMALGLDFFGKETDNQQYTSYDTKTIGGAVRLGFELREDLALQLRYSIAQQEIKLQEGYSSCFSTVPWDPDNKPNGCGDVSVVPSLPVRLSFNQGPQLSSMVGYSLIYNTLDNNRTPTAGVRAELKQEFAGLGGDVSFLRSSGDARFYHEVVPDYVAMLRVQAGNVSSWDGQNLRFNDQFQGGPNLVRGFRQNGFGPRDLTPWTTQDAIGGTNFWAASLELFIPLHFIPKDIGIRASIYADAGSVWNYKGPTSVPGETMTFEDSKLIRTSVGAGLTWDSPFGPLRFDYAIPLTKESYDIVQEFRFGGGTRF